MSNIKYRTVMADPPWLERGGGKSKRGADRHYPLMSKQGIIDTMATALNLRVQPALSVRGVPSSYTHHTQSHVADSCHMWLWATDNFLQDGIEVMAEIGFRYVRSWLWVKMDVDGDGRMALGEEIGPTPPYSVYPAGRLQIGLGRYGRNCHEQLLFGTRGPARVPGTQDRLPSVMFARRDVHSRKPQCAYDLAMRVSGGPALEMFARGPREGWDVWGNEV